MDIPRISSGIDNLDNCLEGGYPLGMTILYTGYLGTGKTCAGIKFLDKSIDSNSVFITTSLPIDQIKILANSLDKNLQNTIFIDGVNWRLKRVNPTKFKSESKYELNNLNDLNSLLSLIIQVCKENSPVNKIFFDTPSSLLLYSTPNEEQVFKFFELLTSYTRSNNINLIYTIEAGIHKNSVVSTLKFFSDGEIDFRRNPKNLEIKEIRVHHLSLTNTKHSWMEF